MTKLAIIIINYNSPEDTLACLRSVEWFAPELNPTILLYDNSDEFPLTAAQLDDFEMPIKFQQNSLNLGFAGAVNQGLKYLLEKDFTHFFLLNNDVLLVDDSLHQMLHYLEMHPTVKIVGGINYFENAPDKVWQAGFITRWCTGKVSPVIPVERVEEVDYVPGSTLLADVSLVQEIGLFDERFFHYFEEYDFCVRARSVSRVMVLPNTRFIHKVENRDRKDSPFVFYYMTRNQLLFARKHRAWWKRIFSTVYLLLYDFLRAIKFEALQQSFPRFTFINTYFKAVWHFVIGKTGPYPNIPSQKRPTPLD